MKKRKWPIHFPNNDPGVVDVDFRIRMSLEDAQRWAKRLGAQVLLGDE